MAIAALVCGILGLVGGFIPLVQNVTGLLCIAAIVLGVIARKQAATTGESTTMATVGMVLGIVGVAFTAVVLVCTICAVGSMFAMAM